MLAVVVDRVELADDLGDLVRAVEVERHGAVLLRRLRIAIRVLGEGAS